jgi:hypothetical protein
MDSKLFSESLFWIVGKQLPCWFETSNVQTYDNISLDTRSKKSDELKMNILIIIIIIIIVLQSIVGPRRLFQSLDPMRSR